MGVYVYDFAGGGGKRGFEKKQRSRILCDFKPTLGMQIGKKGMEYVSKKNNKGNYGVLSHKLVGGGGGASLLKMGPKGMLICFFVKIEMYLGEQIIMIYQDFFQQLNLFFCENLYHFIAHDTSTSNASPLGHDQPNSNLR